MTAPPALAATSTSGETRAPSPEGQTELLVRAAGAILDHVGHDMPRAKVSRIVRRFESQVAGGGWSFFDYFSNAIRLDAEQKRTAALNPDVARAISYADPTGEHAVNVVLRERGF